ncbi:MAG: tRNA (adenosine(37)-N6)-dimethylallyltransferase MiaA [Planctomycetaceae bacterium]|nr:tRNA (adenosine(37)-N6)-dimethylallyltransferase MiaA [Planctomycetaceae bacterium]
MGEFQATDCWFLTGPTAGGKTEIGIALARRIGAEIVSLDSMALYRGMDVGTAKPTAEQRAAVPHHLIDILEPHEEFSLAHYVDAAKACTAEIRNRGREVLFVGGTPLYLKALLRGIFEGPSADPVLRNQLQAKEREQPGSLHRRLAEVDPVAAGRLHPNDMRRLVRALEVFEKTGTPISQWQQQFDRGLPPDRCRVFLLEWPRELLYQRVNRRVEIMFAHGLVEEVAQLMKRGHPLSKTAAQAVGYKEVIEHLRGGPGLKETIELVQTHTRQFAKRQWTWFRSLSECRSVPVAEPVDVEAIADAIRQAGTDVRR